MTAEDVGEKLLLIQFSVLIFHGSLQRVSLKNKNLVLHFFFTTSYVCIYLTTLQGLFFNITGSCPVWDTAGAGISGPDAETAGSAASSSSVFMKSEIKGSQKGEEIRTTTEWITVN